MGAALVGAALNAEWAHLTPTERLVLIAMAHRALDTGNPGRPASIYYGGHDELIWIITGEDSTRGTPEHAAGQRLITRAIRKLIDAGAIDQISAGRRGQRARYKITLGRSQAVDNIRLFPAKVDTHVHQN